MRQNIIFKKYLAIFYTFLKNVCQGLCLSYNFVQKSSFPDERVGETLEI
jgi:hypothetical protein